jgi:hypothetical protein
VKPTLAHYTIETGDLRDSPRDEVTIDLAILAPLLRSGDHALPGPPGYRVRVTTDQGVLAATVSRGPAPLVTVFVCATLEALALAIKVTGTIPAKPLAAPAALVQTHPTLHLDKDAIGWLGDFERCLAWAWVDNQGNQT